MWSVAALTDCVLDSKSDPMALSLTDRPVPQSESPRH